MYVACDCQVGSFKDMKCRKTSQKVHALPPSLYPMSWHCRYCNRSCDSVVRGCICGAPLPFVESCWLSLCVPCLSLSSLSICLVCKTRCIDVYAKKDDHLQDDVCPKKHSRRQDDDKQLVSKKFGTRAAEFPRALRDMSYQDKRRDRTAEFFHESHSGHEIPWECRHCGFPNASVAPLHKGWNCYRVHCVECEKERSGTWICKRCTLVNILTPYNTGKYNMDNVNSPPPHKCQVCEFQTRTVHIYYASGETIPDLDRLQSHWFRQRKSETNLEDVSPSLSDLSTCETLLECVQVCNSQQAIHFEPSLFDDVRSSRYSQQLASWLVLHGRMQFVYSVDEGDISFWPFLTTWFRHNPILPMLLIDPFALKLFPSGIWSLTLSYLEVFAIGKQEVIRKWIKQMKHISRWEILIYKQYVHELTEYQDAAHIVLEYLNIPRPKMVTYK